ncbi:OmpA family protein [Flavobacterium haoranii]|uniref:WD40-like Beta Propeller Repeat n=1 Tax=Flavobacterium haoranii TaxID=683124 RepID=A0A1M6DV73_9FLAO|nr:OmpA family protein [Flavobacterium haoranii]SHI77029.1 WD40-like Beta Propeller Repeat [Flavobacterium haoranii]
MKKLYITLSFVIVSGVLCAQNKDTKVADKLFDKYEYVDAANEYLKLVEKGKSDLYVETQLAESYYNVFNTKEASKWYAKIADQKNDAETYFKYAQMLKAEGKYTEADKQMEKFAALAPKDQRAIAFKNNPNYLNRLKQQAQLFDITPSTISSDKSDFGAVLTSANEVYFSSARNESRKTNGWSDEPYLDIYKAIYNENGTLSEPTAVSEINTKWHDGPVAVTADGNTMYYASESFNEGDFEKNKEKKLKYGKIYLYKATKEGDKWSNSRALPFNSKAYSVRNPAISKDGKTLYFSSDMPGGQGGEDLWKVSVDGDSYGTPENLGTTVNTEGDESFPFVTDNNVLYFASNARQGFGGFDVYKYDLSKGGDVTNIGAPVNTEKDDFSFSFNTQKKVAFFSSNRAGVDNIYLATPICGVNALVAVKDAKTGMPIEGAFISVVDEKGKVVNSDNSAANGNATFGLNCEKEYGFQVSKQGYENGVFTMAKSEGGNVTVEANLEPIKPIITEKEVILQPIFFEFNRSNITPQGASELDKLVEVMNEHPEMVIFVKSHTDSRGSDRYNLNLSERRAKSTVQYVISKGIAKERISGQGFGESEPKVPCDSCTEEQHAENRRSEFLIVKK